MTQSEDQMAFDLPELKGRSDHATAILDALDSILQHVEDMNCTPEKKAYFKFKDMMYAKRGHYEYRASKSQKKVRAVK